MSKAPPSAWQYNFPPFFTLQPNAATRKKQIEAWCTVVIDYCQQNRIYNLDLIEAQNSELFTNSQISRRLNSSGIQEILNALETGGHLEWLDKSKRRFRVIWRSAEEWAGLIYAWALENGFTNSVHTLSELTQDEDNADQSFYGLDEDVLLEALRHLEAQNKAEIIGNREGVKFF